MKSMSTETAASNLMLGFVLPNGQLCIDLKSCFCEGSLAVNGLQGFREIPFFVRFSAGYDFPFVRVLAPTRLCLRSTPEGRKPLSSWEGIRPPHQPELATNS